MAARIKINEHGDCVYTEDTLIELLYQNPDLDISKLYIDKIEQYQTALSALCIDLPDISAEPKNLISIKDFDRSNTERWHMPAQYETLDVEQWLLKKCGNDTEKQRVKDEIKLFNEKRFTKVLQFLIYFVDTLRANNVVWGVGRGSSVSSFCLFLIGIHKINPLEYDLDHREFLR